MILRIAAILAAAFTALPAASEDVLYPDACDGSGVRLQILGSGDADLTDGRAANSFLIWIDGKARVLVDAGSGSALRFGESGARASDIDAILLTRLDAAHALDFPAIIAAAQREERTRPLPLYGPTGGRLAPSTVTFVRTLLDGTRGAYRELSGVLNPLAKDGFKLQPHDVRTRAPSVGVRRNEREIVEVPVSPQVHAAATYVVEQYRPVLAWRIRIGGQNIVLGGTLADDSEHLERLAQAADLLIADDIGEPAEGKSTVGRFAAHTKVKRLVLTRRTRETLDAQEAIEAAVRKDYSGPLASADDLDCFALANESPR